MSRPRVVIDRAAFILILILPALLIQLGAQTAVVGQLASLVQKNLFVYLVSLFLIKIVSIIYPPLPGVAFTIASIPFIGWQIAYIIDIVGSIAGATAAYHLGKRYGFPILVRVAGRVIADRVVRIKLKQRNQFEAAIFLRLASGGLLSDGMAWGASLIGFRYPTFIAGYTVSHIITTMPIFYFVSASISFNSWVVVALAAISAWIVIYKLKGRYFE